MSLSKQRNEESLYKQQNKGGKTDNRYLEIVFLKDPFLEIRLSL